MSDLIDSIKSSKMPIICVCNDKYKQSLKSLKNHCLEIDWRKPTKLQAAARLKKITQTEGLTINQVCVLVKAAAGVGRSICVSCAVPSFPPAAFEPYLDRMLTGAVRGISHHSYCTMT